MIEDTTPNARAGMPPGKEIAFDGQTLKRLTEAGLTWLRTNQQVVNALNVFPVPDGDTGTNMVLTMQSAYNEISESPENNAGKMAHSVAHGALMGARGNSGVILSQLWRGFARSLDTSEVIDADALVAAFATARDTAYKGVVRPVEGTILTVAKDIAHAAEQARQETDNVVKILEKIVQEADASVQRTPELLQVLKDAGVVDSGGKGLYFILDGMVRDLRGLPLDVSLAAVQPISAMKLDEAMGSIEEGQDFEVVVDFKPASPLNLESFYARLEEMGTSIQVGEGDGMYRMHIHVPTENLYEPIEYTRELGTVTKVAIENLIAQMDEIEQSQTTQYNLASVEPGQIAVVAVAPGPGIARVFASLGVASIVAGGQTMNPSTQEILQAFEHLPTDRVIILPNNKNIILAAQAATELTVKQVAVIPSRNVPQGLAAMLRLAPEGDFEDVVEDMTQALKHVQCGEITTATRTVEIDEVQVQEGQIIGLLNGKLVVSMDDLEQACLQLLDEADADDFEIMTLFYGADVQQAQVNQIVDAVRDSYSQLEIEVQHGGQPHYQFILGLE